MVGVEARKDAVFLTDGAEEGVELANRPPPPDLKPPLEPPPPFPRSDGRGEGVRAGLVRELLESRPGEVWTPRSAILSSSSPSCSRSSLVT